MGKIIQKGMESRLKHKYTILQAKPVAPLVVWLYSWFIESAQQRRGKTMTYEEFKVEYTKLFKAAMSYSPDQVGSGHFAEKMADLADAYPEFEERLEDELMPA